MLILGIFLTLITKMCVQNLSQGPQKIFGGLHVARGPHFGHPWHIGLKIAWGNIWIKAFENSSKGQFTYQISNTRC